MLKKCLIRRNEKRGKKGKFRVKGSTRGVPLWEKKQLHGVYLARSVQVHVCTFAHKCARLHVCIGARSSPLRANEHAQIAASAVYTHVRGHIAQAQIKREDA